MFYVNKHWLEHQRQRWMRPDAERWLQPNRRLWIRPEAIDRKFSPDQPRVPAGNPDGGQWTSENGGSGRVVLAGSEKPRLGRGSILAIASELAQRLIDTYRSENGLFDLFRRREGAVAMTEFDGEQIFGSNSTSPTVSKRDREETETLRGTMLQKYPDSLQTDYIGRTPNDALFHAETNVLLRAARKNGGTLAGQSLEVHVDQPMCQSCRRLLPLVGLELGNPTVTFIDRSGAIRTMKDGHWVDGR
jgi:hypothetical protein